MQTTSFETWTRTALSISYNRYTMCASYGDRIRAYALNAM